MKKFLLTGVLALAFLGAKADYTSMTFSTLDDVEHVIDISGLEIGFVDGKLVATSDNSTLTLPMSSLKSMQFSNDDPTDPEPEPSAIATVGADCASSVTLYSIDGVCRGVFSSINEASQTLPKGVYILKTETGFNTKIAIRK